MSSPALNWVAALGGEHLLGAARNILWAAANRAGDGGPKVQKRHPGEEHLVTLSGRRWVEEAGVDYRHFYRLLPQLVDLKVLELLERGKGTRASVYKFTFRDPAGLPALLGNEPQEPPPLRSITDVDWRDAMDGHEEAGGDRAAG